MKNVWVVVYKAGMIALPFAYAKQEDAKWAMRVISVDDNMRVRQLEIK